MNLMTYSQTAEELQANANQVKTAVLSRLLADRQIKSDLDGQYIVVIAKRGWFGKAIDKLWGLEDDVVTMHVVRLG